MSKLEFDAASGNLIGSKLPPVPMLIEGARCEGMGFRAGDCHDIRSRCGCAIEVAGWLAGESLNGTARLGEYFGLNCDDAMTLGLSFDQGEPVFEGEGQSAAAEYGVAVRRAAESLDIFYHIYHGATL